MNMPRIRMLRAQVEALEAFRDSMFAAMDAEEYDNLATTLIPTTDRILHELAELEQGDAYVPYPHPHGTGWWLTEPEEAA